MDNTIKIELEDVTKAAAGPSGPTSPTPAAGQQARAMSAGPIANVLGSFGSGFGPVGQFLQQATAFLGAKAKETSMAKAATAGDIPTVKAPTFGDLMAARPGGSITRTDAQGIPYGRAATMGEVMGASAKGNIPEATAEVGAAGGAEGGAAGGMGGLAAAAGPVGAAVVAVTYIADKIATKIGDAVRAIGNVATQAGAATASAMGGNNADAIGQVAHGFVELSGEMPLFGKQMKLINEQAEKFVGAFARVVGAIVERGRELSGYNASLATSYASSDVRSLLGDIREAQALGPGLARINDATSRLSDDLRELLLPIKEWLIDFLAAWLERFAALIERYEPSIVQGFAVIENLPTIISEAIATTIPFSGTSIEDFKAHMAQILDNSLKANERRKDTKTDLAAMTARFLALLEAGRPPAPPKFGQGPPENIGQRLNIPLVASIPRAATEALFGTL